MLIIQNEKGITLKHLRIDHGKEFENISGFDFYEAYEISHEFSAPMTLQQNGVVERRNKTI